MLCVLGWWNQIEIVIIFLCKMTILQPKTPPWIESTIMLFYRLLIHIKEFALFAKTTSNTRWRHRKCEVRRPRYLSSLDNLQINSRWQKQWPQLQILGLIKGLITIWFSIIRGRCQRWPRITPSILTTSMQQDYTSMVTHITQMAQWVGFTGVLL